MKEWMESIRELKKRADKKFYEEDFVDLCLIGKKMVEQLVVISTKLPGYESEIDEIRHYFSRYAGEEDMFKPYLASLWGGMPDRDEGKRCMELIEKIVKIAESLTSSV